MRNGMSVEEVYEKLDRLEKLEKEYAGLATDFMDLVAAYDDLVNGVGKAVFYFDNVSNMYANAVASPEATKEDELEFGGKISGLAEAKAYILKVLEECLGSEHEGEKGEEEKSNDLPGETEGAEPSV